jgi:hypothetical protein
MAEHEAPATKNPMISDSMYTKLEYLARVVLPALAVLYVALASLWGFPNGAAVVGTITALDTFLGVFLGFAQKAYDASPAKYDGNIVIMNTQDGGKTFSLELDKHPDELAQMTQVVFKVDPTNA